MITLYQRRRIVNVVAIGVALLMTMVALGWLAMILGALFSNGIEAISWRMFTESTPPPGSDGGIANAIYGSAIMTLMAVVVATPIGVLAGTYLSEYAHHGHIANGIRITNDILLSAPSIIIGLFVYELMVVPMHHFSGWAGVVALAIIAVPIIVRTTEDMMSLVPDALREAAIALGAPKWWVIVTIGYRAAFQGLITGTLLAVARISGETAPLLFTALNNQFWSTDLNGPMANLPVVIFQFAMSPYQEWRHLAWGGALLITVTVLVLNIVARLVGTQRRAAR